MTDQCQLQPDGKLSGDVTVASVICSVTVKFYIWLGDNGGGKLVRYFRKENQDPKEWPQADSMG